MKNILFIRSNAVNPDSRVEKEAITLKKRGYNIEVLAWDREKNYKLKKQELNIENITISIYRKGIKAAFGVGFKKNIFPLIKFQIYILYFLIKNNKKIDIIHACDFDTAFSSFIFAKIFRKKIIYDIFDFYIDCCNVPKKMRRIILNLDNYIISHSDVVILCTEKRKEQIKGSFPKKIEIIHNTPSEKILKNEYLKNNEKIKIVYVGVLLKEERLIEELINVIKENKNYELHIGGFGVLEKEIKEISNKYENIIFYGKISYEKTLELESQCDIMTAIYDPEKRNHYYAAPNKFYEALMLGKPLIMVKGTGMSEIVEKNNIGEIIDFNKESLKKGIEKLVERRNEWEEISKKMKKIYEEDFSWKEMEKRLINLYEEL